MHFDIGLFTCQVPPTSNQTPGQRYRELLDLAPLAEKVGFEKAWVSEHHFVEDGYLPGVFSFCAALAARTSTMRIGTGIALGPFYEPLRFAEDSAVIDLLSNGRFEPGLAIGWTDPEFEAFDVPKRLRVPYTEELIDVLRQAWSDEPISYNGDIHQYKGVDVRPKPVQENIPIWIAGTVDAAVIRAATKGNGYFATPTSLDELSRRQSLYQEKADSSEETRLAEWRYTYVTEEPEPWEQAKQHVWYIKRQYIKWATGTSQPTELPPEREEDLREECLVGSPEEVRNQVEERRDRLGDDYRLVARLTLPGLSGQQLRQSVKLFGDEVIDQIS